MKQLIGLLNGLDYIDTFNFFYKVGDRNENNAKTNFYITGII